MIKVERVPADSPYPPELLAQVEKRIYVYFDLDRDQRVQRRFPLDQEWSRILPIARKALDLTFHGKCAYCESSLHGGAAMEIDHFRPKVAATDLKGEGSTDHYVWLGLEWRNHYASCQVCNRAKRNFFPVNGDRAEMMMPYEQVVETEDPFLVDPCNDDPEQHLDFTPEGFVSAITARGETTIRVLNLNREALVRARREAFELTKYEVRRILAEFVRESRESANERIVELLGLSYPHLAMRRLAVRTAVEGLGKGINAMIVEPEIRSADVVIEEDAEAFRLTARALQTIEVRNFRLLRDLKVTLPEPGGERAPCLMLLGENARGKSSLLQAIGMALAGATEADRFVNPNDVLTRGAEDGFVRLFFWDNPTPVELHYRRGATRFTGTERPSAIVLGYGALRHPEPESPVQTLDTRRFARLDPLLLRVAMIPNAAPYLLSLDPDRFLLAARSLRAILPLGEDGDLVREDNKVQFRIGDHVAPLSELSAGYQTIIGMGVDIMRLLFERWSTLESAGGIVLIDEIDSHLHPRWKLRIVRALREAFPQVQFIASTHDPLILRGVRNGEVVLLRREPGALGTIIADQNLPPVEGMPIEDLLTSRHFGLETLVEPEVEAKLAELYHLQSLPAKERDEARIITLRAEVGDREALGRNRREQAMLEAADQYLMMTPDPDAEGAKTALSAATVRRLQALLDRTRPVS